MDLGYTNKLDLGYTNKRSCITTHILPNDVLYLVLEKLGTQDQHSFGLTCRSFLDIQDTSRKCLKLGCGRYKNCLYHAIFLDAVNIVKLLKRFTQLQSLCLGSCISVSDSSLALLLKYASKLHSLYLDECFRLTDKGLASVASGCQLLSFISLSRCRFTDSGLEILTNLCKSLKEVNLAWCRNITDNGIRSLNQNCRQLRSLNIYGCDRVNGEGFKGLSETLAFIEAEHCVLYSMDDVVGGDGLEYLNLCRIRNRIGRNGLASIGLGFSPNLKILNFCYFRFVKDDAIINISKGCLLLQEWNLSYCRRIGISGWESIELYCKNMKIIHVNICDKLCDRGLQYLGGCKNMSMIYMKHCYGVTTSGLRDFKIKREDVKSRYEII